MLSATDHPARSIGAIGTLRRNMVTGLVLPEGEENMNSQKWTDTIIDLPDGSAVVLRDGLSFSESERDYIRNVLLSAWRWKQRGLRWQSALTQLTKINAGFRAQS